MNQTSDHRPPRLAAASERIRLTSDLRSRQLGFGLILFLLLFQFWSRYLPSPMAVFVADDWANWARSSFYASHAEAIRTGLQDPNRPLSMAAVEYGFRVFGNEPVSWTWVSLIGNGLLLFSLVMLAWRLTGRRAVAVIAGLLFAVFPNLTETYHWSTQVLNEVSCALMWYVASGWLWVEHTRRGGAGRLAGAALCYFVALFSYEAGLLIPGAYVFLLPWIRQPVKSVLRLAPFAGVAMLYVAWRSTNAFGMNQSWFYPPHMEAGISLSGMWWNANQLIHWWVGDQMAGSVLRGLMGLATISPGIKTALMVANGLVVLFAAVVIKRAVRCDAADVVAPFATGPVLLFGLGWLAASSAIPILSYTAPRLNVLPAVGVALVLGVVLARCPLRGWGMVALVPAWLALASNQGTAESYRQAGEFNQRLFRNVLETKEIWQGRDTLLFDTTRIRERLTPGLLTPPSEDQMVWAQYHNALMIRGFVPMGMVRLALGTPEPPMQVLHDVENGARVEGSELFWHERYQPAITYRTPMEWVYVFDLGDVCWPDR